MLIDETHAGSPLRSGTEHPALSADHTWLPGQQIVEAALLIVMMVVQLLQHVLQVSLAYYKASGLRHSRLTSSPNSSNTRGRAK